MIEFNNPFQTSLYLNGFKFVLYTPKDDHGLLHPIKNEAPQSIIEGTGAYQLGMMDEEVIDMANGVLDFKFYIAEDFFDSKEVYNVLPRQ